MYDYSKKRDYSVMLISYFSNKLIMYFSGAFN
jgi:hypothetical protein